MDKREVRQHALALYRDEFALTLDQGDEFEAPEVRRRAAVRLAAVLVEGDLADFALSLVEAVARQVEREFEIDATTGQLRIGGALRVDELTFTPVDKAKQRDWLAWDERREAKLQEHIAKREHERELTRHVVDRMRERGGDPTTAEACPELFTGEAAA